MLIIGAKGFAKELLQILENNKKVDGLAFYDDMNKDIKIIFEKFPVLKTEIEVKRHFKLYGNDFLLGIGNPFLRYQICKKFQNLEGNLSSCISQYSRIGNYSVNIGAGTNILDNAIISNNVKIGIGCIIYYNAVITHDCIIDDFVEISPSVNLLGRCKIGSYTHIGANATILPDVTIGKNVVVGAGAVVTKNIFDNSVAVGVPAKVIKSLDSIDHNE